MHPRDQSTQSGNPAASYLPDQTDYNSLVHYTRWKVEPYPAVYVTQDDILLVKIWSPNASSLVNISTRIQVPDGRIVASFYSFNVAGVGATPVQQVIEQIEGFILSATVETPAAPYGQCYVQLQIVRGRGTGDQTAGQLLCAGYPGAGFAIGFPQTPAGGPLTGAGQTGSTTGTNPAAGADWTYTVPAGFTQVLVSVRAVLTTSAVVANRVPVLRITIPTGQIVADIAAIAAQTASTTITYVWMAGAPANNTNNVQQMSLPQGLRLPAGSVVQTITAGISAGDQWSSISITYTQFISA